MSWHFKKRVDQGLGGLCTLEACTRVGIWPCGAVLRHVGIWCSIEGILEDVKWARTFALSVRKQCSADVILM
jgi:hypothetical protein